MFLSPTVLQHDHCFIIALRAWQQHDEYWHRRRRVTGQTALFEIFSINKFAILFIVLVLNGWIVHKYVSS
ncbi:hypothetical protein CHS0354_015053 [Potamilus streckersoni]|uniref:Uncharacterized protein n=1 Tax=Potamilus streckersoni TaxID=2493646 RepID=A0AAE0TG94_9BIVA|nr:hypothetical protein CHS0354_015053 [Potamilus streckersoni]